MAGHSKWANIKHRKGRQDEKRQKVFSKLIRELTVAAKLGGPEPGLGPRQRPGPGPGPRPRPAHLFLEFSLY